MASRWQNPPTAFLKVIEQDFSKETKRIAGMLLQAVITQSPVKDGIFRGNHRISIGNPDVGYDLATEDEVGGRTLQIGIASIATAPTYGRIFIQNNVPYALKLELGSSKQAEFGVYGVSFNAVVQRLNSR